MDGNRLLFHLMPPKGWMNDPNGLCQFQGVYHVFFQYTPDNPKGGNKLWGHYTSRDMIHWNYEGEPLKPDKDFDRDGVFSGSAFLYDGKMYLYYTGNVEQEGDHDYVHTGREANTILVTSTDGMHLSEKQCIMTNQDYPPEYTCHIRDPKVWQQDGHFYMIQGGRLIGDKGAVLIFQSEDLMHWEFYKDITTEYDFGFMWECPDYFTLSVEEKEVVGVAGEGKKMSAQEKASRQGILSLSPQGLEAQEYRYQNIYQSGYFLVQGDILNNPSLGEFTEWDMGFDFYAPQTFLDEKGRRILIGWAGLADDEYDNKPTIQNGWQHALTVPRVLTWNHGKVYQNPVEELEQLRQKKRKFKAADRICLQDGQGGIHQTLPEKDFGVNGRKAYEIDLEIKESDGFQINFDQLETGFCIRYEAGVFTMEFYGEQAKEMGRGRKVRKVLLEKFKNCRILLDTSLVEIYLNQGEVVLTSRYYIENKKDQENPPFIMKCMGGTFQGTIWELVGFFAK